MKNITGSFKNTRLVSKNNKEFQKYCLAKKLERQSNVAETVTDKKMFVGIWLEKVIISELSEFHIFSENNIIRWEGESTNQRTHTYFKEVDAVINVSNSNIAIVEIKGSFSKTSIKDGLVQIKNSEVLLQKVYKNISSILIFADCRCIDSDFGYASSEIIDTLLNEKGFLINDSLNILKGEIPKEKICIFLDKIQVTNFIKAYGNPYADLIHDDL
jgi:hypothetical protein